MSHGPAHWDDLLTEQRDYYRARAGEYYQWWLRQGRYDRGPDFQTRWTAEVQQLTDALRRSVPEDASWSWHAERGYGHNAWPRQQSG